MLAITCKDGSRFRLDLGDGRFVYVWCEIKRGDRARLGITAPDSVGIWRDEVWLKRVSQRFLVVLQDEPVEAMA